MKKAYRCIVNRRGAWVWVWMWRVREGLVRREGRGGSFPLFRISILLAEDTRSRVCKCWGLGLCVEWIAKTETSDGL